MNIACDYNEAPMQMLSTRKKIASRVCLGHFLGKLTLRMT